MQKQSVTFIKRTLKVLLWVLVSLVFLLFATALLVQVPSVQNALIHKVTSFISNKTHSKVEAGILSILFPESISLREVFVEDLSHDTLLYASEINVNLDMFALIKGNISIENITLKRVTAHLVRTA